MKDVRIFHGEAAVFQVTAKGVKMEVDKVDNELNEPNIRGSLLVCSQASQHFFARLPQRAERKPDTARSARLWDIYQLS